MAEYDLNLVRKRIEALERSLYPCHQISVIVQGVKFFSDTKVFTADITIINEQRLESTCEYPEKYFEDCIHKTSSEKAIEGIDGRYTNIITALYAIETKEMGITLYNIKQHIQRINLYNKWMHAEDGVESPLFYCHKLSNYLDDAERYMNMLNVAVG